MVVNKELSNVLNTCTRPVMPKLVTATYRYLPSGLTNMGPAKPMLKPAKKVDFIFAVTVLASSTLTPLPI